MNHFKYILEFLIPLITQPQQAWQYLSETDGDRRKPDYMQHHYYFPLLGFMAFVVFLCAGYHRVDTRMTFDFQLGMTQMVPLLVGYLVGPYVSLLLLRQLVSQWYKQLNLDRDSLHLFVFYSTSFLLALEMVLAIAPSIRFFSFLNIYLINITFKASGAYFRIPDGNKWVFSFGSFVVILACPILIIKLLQLMQG